MNMIPARAPALGRRALGFGYLALALAPMLLIAIVLAIVVGTMFEVVALSRQKVTAVTEILDHELTPRIAAIRSGYDEVVRNVEHVGDEFVHVSRLLGNLPDITIQRGQFGATQTLPLRIPDREVEFGLIHIANGQLFNQTLPSIQIPAAAMTIPTGPIRQALAPLGENGPIARALAESTERVGRTVDEVKRLGAPLGQVQSEIGAWFAPLHDYGTRITTMIKVTVAILALLVILYVAAAIHILMTRRREAGLAFRIGGPLGCLHFVNAHLFLDGYARLRGRDPVADSVSRPDGLALAVERLDAEVRRLRAELAGLPTARPSGPATEDAHLPVLSPYTA
jgi:hypothetical protein